MKFIRIVLLYVLFFVVALIIGGMFVQQLGDGLFVLFTFIAPGLAVWWYEKHRTRRLTVRHAQPTNSIGTRRSSDPPIASTGAATRTSSWEPQRAAAPASEIRTATQAYQPIVKPSRRQGWVPRGEVVSIRGREIGGMVYVGTPPSMNTYGYGEKCRAYIDPSLPVAREGNDKDGNGMPYWPGYSSIPPECRATYLDWLASGAVDGSYNPGYMFLYFYGLERRFFVDEPSLEEKHELLREVRRVLHVFPDNWSAKCYLGRFIDFALAATTEPSTIPPTFDTLTAGSAVPYSVKLAIGSRLQNGDNLSADWMLSWFLCHPEKNLRTSAKRCRQEFMGLFRLRFEQRFPEGLKVPKPRKSLEYGYAICQHDLEAMRRGNTRDTEAGERGPV